MTIYRDYHYNLARSHQHSAYLHASGAREFIRRGLHSTAAIWQELAAHHSKHARISMERYALARTVDEWHAASAETGLMA